MNQPYTTKATEEYVILGNDAIVACKVPSFVADFVDVVGWVDGIQQQEELGARGRHGAESVLGESLVIRLSLVPTSRIKT